jgi:hypothetical protein
MEARLIVIGGNMSKRNIALRLPAIIGRSPEAKVTINHPMISRRHCEVFENDGLLMVRDLGSLNGTSVDGRRIKEAPLPPNAEFSIGPLSFRTEYEFQGDPGKLPPVVFAEPTVAVPASSDAPDSAAVGDPTPLTTTLAENVATNISDDDLFLEQIGILPASQPKASNADAVAARAKQEEAVRAQGSPAKAQKLIDKSKTLDQPKPVASGNPAAAKPVEKPKAMPVEKPKPDGKPEAANPAGKTKPAANGSPAPKARANTDAKSQPAAKVAEKPVQSASDQPVKNSKADPFDELLDNL